MSETRATAVAERWRRRQGGPLRAYRGIDTVAVESGASAKGTDEPSAVACGSREAHAERGLRCVESDAGHVALHAGDEASLASGKEGPMLSQRNTQYWLWVLLFGVISALSSGLLGLVLGLFVSALRGTGLSAVTQRMR
jgi:hypothetical protein